MPRELVFGGLPGPGQDIFPEDAREITRNMALYPEEITILRMTKDKVAGAERETFTPDPGGPVRGRVDPTSSNTAGVLRGDVIRDESSEHLFTFENGQSVTTDDRLLYNGNDWIITSLRERTDELVVRVEARLA